MYSYYFSQTLAALQLFMASVKNSTCHAVWGLWLLTDLFSARLKRWATAHGEATEKNRQDKTQGYTHFSIGRFKSPQDRPEELLLELAARIADGSLPTWEKTPTASPSTTALLFPGSCIPTRLSWQLLHHLFCLAHMVTQKSPTLPSPCPPSPPNLAAVDLQHEQCWHFLIPKDQYWDASNWAKLSRASNERSDLLLKLNNTFY